MKQCLPPALQFPNQLVLDFGPRLKYDEVCTAYTVQRMSLWTYFDQDIHTFVIREKEMHKARVEGTLYFLPQDEDIIELDRRRQVGVCCERKYLPVWTPYKNDIDEFIQVMAWVYVGNPDYYVPKIQEDMDFHSHIRIIRDGVPAPCPGKFSKATVVPDAHRLLNNRFSFHDPGYYCHPEKDVSPRIAEYVGKKNREEIERLNQQLDEINANIKRLRKQQRWERFKKFLSE